MTYLRILFLLLIVNQSFLFAQFDSIKKSFKPYGLIDAAPVAIDKNDFKPQISISIQSVDLITNVPIDAKIDYFTASDSILTEKSGKVVSIQTTGNEKIVLILNATGYMFHSQPLNTPLSDTSYVFKFSKIKKGDKIMLHAESQFHSDLLALQEFLKLNSGVKIQIFCYPCGAEKVFIKQLQGVDKKRIRINCSQKQKSGGTFIVKILHN